MTIKNGGNRKNFFLFFSEDLRGLAVETLTFNRDEYYRFTDFAHTDTIAAIYKEKRSIPL